MYVEHSIMLENTGRDLRLYTLPGSWKGHRPAIAWRAEYIERNINERLSPSRKAKTRCRMSRDEDRATVAVCNSALQAIFYYPASQTEYMRVQ